MTDTKKLVCAWTRPNTHWAPNKQYVTHTQHIQHTHNAHTIHTQCTHNTHNTCAAQLKKQLQLPTRAGHTCADGSCRNVVTLVDGRAPSMKLRSCKEKQNQVNKLNSTHNEVLLQKVVQYVLNECRSKFGVKTYHTCTTWLWTYIARIIVEHVEEERHT